MVVRQPEDEAGIDRPEEPTWKIIPVVGRPHHVRIRLEPDLDGQRGWYLTAQRTLFIHSETASMRLYGTYHRCTQAYR